MASARGVAVAIIALAGVGGIVAYLLTRKPSAVSVSVKPSSLAQGAVLNWSASGLTLGEPVGVDVIFPDGTDLGFVSNLVASASGTVSAYFTVATNIPIGVNTLKITDTSSGRFGTCRFTVT